MAAQTEAPDDLIAELARLMADDARGGKPAGNEQTPPVRIPGDTSTAPAPAPVPRFDFSASTNLASGNAASPVRIPGGDASSTEVVEPFPFNFDFTPTTAVSAPATPVLSAAPSTSSPLPVSPSSTNLAAPVASTEQEPVPLDQDSLADLIAAELAADMDGVEVSEAPSTAPKAEPATAPDRFGVPPVFGLGSAQGRSTPVAPQPQPSPAPEPVSAPRLETTPAAPVASADAGSLDPLDDIERLVGPAVRMNVASASPAPSLRSLATPTIVEPVVRDTAQVDTRSVAPEPEARGNSVDEAILAAAAATGAHVEWVDAHGDTGEIVDDAEALAPPPRRGFRMNRSVAGPLVAIGLLTIAGLGLYWVLGQGGGATGPAPLLVADTTPTKEVPEVDTTESAPQSVVFNEISGAADPVDEQLVSRDQADTESVVAANSAPAGSGVITDGTVDGIDPNQDGLVNRKVRTVTVRPDGTIVSGDDSLAGSAILPVDRPNVPEVPGADISTPDLIASAASGTETSALAAQPEATTTPAVTPAEPGAAIAVVDAAGAPISGRTVTMPMQRPSDFQAAAASAIASAGATPAAGDGNAVSATPLATAPTATAPVQPAPAAVTNTAGSASAYVQLASQRSEDAARQSAQAVATRFGVLFSGASPEILRVDLGERGVYYRVVVPAPSRDAAANICTNVKAAGGDCLLL